MDSLLAFLIFIAAATAIGWQAGNHQDRTIMVIICVAAVLTASVDALSNGNIKILLVAVIDVTLLVVVLRAALHSKRYWPIWFASIHFVGLVCQAAALSLSHNSQIILAYLGGICSIAAVCAMVGGLLLDQRANDIWTT